MVDEDQLILVCKLGLPGQLEALRGGDQEAEGGVFAVICGGELKGVSTGRGASKVGIVCAVICGGEAELADGDGIGRFVTGGDDQQREQEGYE